jgi:two-component system, NarL family, invasion response regulator UvrY
MNNILIADDHLVIRTSLKIYVKNIIPHSIIEEAYDGDSALEKIKHNDYDLIILDVNMPDTDPFGLVTNILAVKPKSKILIFSMNPGEMYAKNFLSLGVLGYLNKAAFTDEIGQAIESVMNNKKYVSPALSQMLTEEAPGQDSNNRNPFDLLSQQELEVATHLMKGEPVSQISSILHLHILTVDMLKIKIFEKLDCKNIEEMKELAATYNFIQPV